jgi:tetratricopeptide (TPR) repeat protein
MVSVRSAAGDTLPPLEGWHLGKGEWQAAYAYELPTEAALQRTMVAAALAADPQNPEYRFISGRSLYQRSNFRGALAEFEIALRRMPNDPELLLLAGIAANNLQLGAGSDLLRRAEAAPGGDSAYAASVLAETAVAQGDWQGGAAAIMRALRGVRPTIHTPFTAQMEHVVRSFAAMGPILFAVPVLQTARETRPSWDVAYWGGAQLFARWGGEHCRQAAELAEELPRRFGWTTAEAIGMLRPCAARH